MWFGNCLKQRRKKLGWTIEVAARNIGISERYLHKMEANERFPKLDTLRKVAVAYKVPMWLFLYCSEDGVKIERGLASTYKEMRLYLTQFVNEVL